MSFFLLYLIFLLIISSFSAVYETTGCESIRNPNISSDCSLEPVDKGYVCCFTHLSFLGTEQKNCYEYLKGDIYDNNIKNTIYLIEIGRYWDSEVQMYEVLELYCGSERRGRVWIVVVEVLMLIVLL